MDMAGNESNDRGNPILEIEELQTAFRTPTGEMTAVDGISFSIGRGEAVGIVGESGSGKSVTSLSVMRLLPQPHGRITGGRVRFFHEGEWLDLTKLPNRDMRHIRGAAISMIFQEPMTSLNPVFTCGEQVAEAVRLHRGIGRKEAKHFVLDLFRQVELPDPVRIWKAYPHQLSGGQKQRVMIAMALSCNPSVLIADEPTTALDVTVQNTILGLMRNLQRDLDMGLIFITHDLGVIAEVADRVLVMYEGKIVEQGSVEQIFRQPQHPYTKALLACRPPLEKRYKRLPTISDFIETGPDGQWIEKPVDVSAVIRSVEWPPEEIRQRLESLMASIPVLEVKNLVTRFPGQRSFFGRTKKWIRAVNDVSFVVYPGETLGLVGESGCGKTTLGRSILRLVEPHAGEVLYKGLDLLRLSQKELKPWRKRMQIIFQDPYSSLNPRMTAGQAITEPMKVHGLEPNRKRRTEKAIELLESVGLEADHFYRYPHEFSGGQRQRICIARALALQPEFIICDESVSALDVSVQAQVLNLLADLRERFNLTYIFISHDLSVVRFISDRIMVMNDGKIEETGPADQIYFNPRKAYTRRLIEAIPKGL